jgi:hypothetical protein
MGQDGILMVVLLRQEQSSLRTLHGIRRVLANLSRNADGFLEDLICRNDIVDTGVFKFLKRRHVPLQCQSYLSIPLTTGICPEPRPL